MFATFGWRLPSASPPVIAAAGPMDETTSPAATADTVADRQNRAFMHPPEACVVRVGTAEHEVAPPVHTRSWNSVQPAHGVAGRSVRGDRFACVLVAAHPAPCGDVGTRGGVVGLDDDRLADRDVADVAGE